MAKGRVPLTRDGRNKICEELEFFKTEKRREVAKALAEARAHGDLSENAEYDAAKADQAKNEKKIAELEDLLMRAQIIDESAMPNDEVSLGVTVRVKDLNTGEEFDYMFVSEEESDYSANKISISSPVGKALIGHKVGEEVMIKVPVGFLKYAILTIKR